MKKHFAQDVADAPATSSSSSSSSDSSSSSSDASQAESEASLEDQPQDDVLNLPADPVVPEIRRKLEEASAHPDIIVPESSFTFEQPFVFHRPSGLFICLEHQQAFHVSRVKTHCKYSSPHQLSDAYHAALARNVQFQDLQTPQEESEAYLNQMSEENRIPFVKMENKFQCDWHTCQAFGGYSLLQKHQRKLPIMERLRHSYSKCLAIAIYDDHSDRQKLYKVSTDQPLRDDRNEAAAFEKAQFALFREKTALIPTDPLPIIREHQTAFEMTAKWQDFVRQHAEQFPAIKESISHPLRVDAEDHIHFALARDYWAAIDEIMIKVGEIPRQALMDGSLHRAMAVFRPLQKTETNEKYQKTLAHLISFVMSNHANRDLIPENISAHAQHFSDVLNAAPANREYCLQLLHELLYMLVDKKHGSTGLEPFTILPLYQFLIFKCTESDKTLCSHYLISQRIAQLQYIVRLIIANDLRQFGLQKGDLDEHLELVKLNRLTPMGALFWAKTILNEKKVGDLVPKVMWKSDGLLGASDTVLIINDKEVSVAALQQAYANAMAAANRLLAKILPGIQREKLLRTKYSDNPNDSRDKFCFLNHGDQNWYETGQQKVFNMLLKVLELNVQQNTANNKKAKDWLCNVQQLMRVLLFLIHLTSGQPARATELAPLQYRNSQQCRRHLFFYHGKMLVNPVYYKTNSMLQVDKGIFRVIPAAVADIVVLILTFIRPFEM